mmetsp:Transcript_24093/g.4021  ORF Transcript_24093/g.4021 Transcript_24093/m.4021 type:complete len:96 (+) Transcript_24093:174-461(+)
MINYPKSTENSLILFESLQAEKYLTRIRFAELFVYPTVLFTNLYWLPKIILGSWWLLQFPTLYSMCSFTVTRMELIPHLEAVQFHKVGVFGKRRT